MLVLFFRAKGTKNYQLSTQNSQLFRNFAIEYEQSKDTFSP
jgi:hypothetical protein